MAVKEPHEIKTKINLSQDHAEQRAILAEDGRLIRSPEEAAELSCRSSC